MSIIEREKRSVCGLEQYWRQEQDHLQASRQNGYRGCARLKCDCERQVIAIYYELLHEGRQMKQHAV